MSATSLNNSQLTLAVVIPTLRRPKQLIGLLNSLNQQVRKPDEILVVCMHDDYESQRVVCEWARRSPLGSLLKLVTVFSKGHLPPLIAALQNCQSDIFCQIDDDALPHNDWLLRIHSAFGHGRIGAVGGKVINHKTQYGGSTANGIQVLTPGRLSWYGRSRSVGREECATGNLLPVDYLLGGNMTFRTSALFGCIDITLNGGSSTLYEIDVCLNLQKKGFHLFYDPHMIVEHYPAPRYVGVERGINSKECYWYAHNLTYICLKHLTWYGKISFLLYFFVGGQWAAPAIATYLLGAVTRHPVSLREQLLPSLKGRLAGMRSYYTAHKIFSTNELQ